VDRPRRRDRRVRVRRMRGELLRRRRAAEVHVERRVLRRDDERALRFAVAERLIVAERVAVLIARARFRLRSVTEARRAIAAAGSSERGDCDAESETPCKRSHGGRAYSLVTDALVTGTSRYSVFFRRARRAVWVFVRACIRSGGVPSRPRRTRRRR